MSKKDKHRKKEKVVEIVRSRKKSDYLPNVIIVMIVTAFTFIMLTYFINIFLLILDKDTDMYKIRPLVPLIIVIVIYVLLTARLLTETYTESYTEEVIIKPKEVKQ